MHAWGLKLLVARPCTSLPIPTCFPPLKSSGRMGDAEGRHVSLICINALFSLVSDQGAGGGLAAQGLLGSLGFSATTSERVARRVSSS